MAMAGRQQAGEGMSSRDSAQAGMSFGGGLDHFLRRLDSANDAAEPVAGATSQASPTSNSIAALVSNYDDLSPNPVNPWQYLSLSNPASPISQREYFNHLSAHTSGSGGHNSQATEWNMLEELEQQRALSAMTSRAPTMNHQDLQSPAREAENSEAAASFMYEEAAAAAAWYRNGGYLRGSDAALYESLARLDTQASDGEATVRSWEQGMYFGAGAETVQDPPEAAPGSSTRSANSVRTPSNTSQSSGSNGDDSDEEECMRKRKTPEPSTTGEDGNDSARTSSEAELKKTAASLLRRRSSFKKPREPRYAIKTRTDVDIMDDGFKWRKYGQKAVKNSPHPRNYYRCTTPQCPVRKRVERSHEDSGLVITTYEGMHTHQAPGFCGPSLPQFVPPRPVPAAALFAGFPPEFSQLAALHQLRALQQVARLAQMAPRPPFPSSIRRAQQFLGLKQEPTFYDFMAQLPSFGNFQPPSSGASFLDRMRQQQMRGPAPPMDADLVRRVLEAEDIPGADVTDANVDSSAPAGETFANQIQSSLRSRVELERRMSMQRRHSSDNLGSTSSSQHRAWQPRHHGDRDDDSLVDGLLLQEMAQPNATRKSID